MKGYNLMQAIHARVNRVFADKEGGAGLLIM